MQKLILLLAMLAITILTGCSGDSGTTEPTNLAPTVTITSPANSALFVPGDLITIKATATDSDGSIAKVDFYVDGVVVSNDLVLPYEYTWNTTGVTNGSHALKAVAVDNDGAVKTSEVNIMIGYVPSVNITEPSNNTLFTPGATINLKANCTDLDGTITKVDFLIDSTLISSANNTPYEFAWNTTGAVSGSYLLIIKATDNSGAINSDSVVVQVGYAPTVLITSPYHGQACDPGSTINITATATSQANTNGKSVAKVDFYIDGILKSSDTVSPYTYIWGTTAADMGLHKIKAVATSSYGFLSVDSTIVLVRLPPVPTMVLVNGGTFQMGGYGNAAPVHSVTISSFYIGKYEVTQTEWVATMGTNPSYFTGDLNLPVESISWYDIMVYCNKRSIGENLMPCYTINGSNNPTDWGTVPSSSDTTGSYRWNKATCNWIAKGYRMPTEAEWEFAARGGNSSQGYICSGSNHIDYVAWNLENSIFATHSVGTKLPNELDIYDMSGNVMEWNWDWYGNYSSTDQINPTGATSGTRRVLRGGSCSNGGNICMVANRDYRYAPYMNHNGNPFLDGSSNGFRVARTY